MSLTSKFRKFIPTLNRVLVQKIENDKRPEKGIILSTKEATVNIGKIVALGEGNRNESGVIIPISLKVGSTVLLPEYGGSKVELKDGEFFVYRDNEIVGILEDPAN